MVELGADVVADEASATYEDGILRVELPLAPPSSAARRVPIDRSGRWTERRPPSEDRSRRRRRGRRRGRAGSRCRRRCRCCRCARRVAFPDTLTPLAVGQERSIKLVNDVLGGNRMLVMVASQRPRDRGARPRRPLRRRRRRRGRAHAEGARRHAAHPRPGRRSGSSSATTSPTEPYLVARDHRAARRGRARRPSSRRSTRNVQRTFSRDHRADPVPARGAAARGRERRRPVGARAPDRRRAADQDRGEAGAARGASTSAKRLRRLSRDPRPRARGGRARHARSSRRSSRRWTRASASTSCASS